jgi:hypothetical protein
MYCMLLLMYCLLLLMYCLLLLMYCLLLLMYCLLPAATTCLQAYLGTSGLFALYLIKYAQYRHV